MPNKQAASEVHPIEKVALLCGDEEATAIGTLLKDERIELIPHDFAALCTAIKAGDAAAVLIGIEFLSRGKLKQLRRAIEAQRSWSDVIILLLAERDSLNGVEELLEFGRITIIERPIHPFILVRAIRSVKRSGRRLRGGLAVAVAMDANHTRQIAALEALSRQLSEEVEERRRTEEALRESEQLYRYMVELSQQIVWTAMPDRPAVVSGSRLSEVTGAPPQASLREVIDSAIHPEDRAQSYERWEEQSQSGKLVLHEFRMRVADGSYHVFISRAVPRLDEHGNVVRWYGFIEDINDQKLAMEALRQAEERYRLAARATNDAIWDWNVLTGHIAWSDAAAAYLGAESLENSTIQWWEQAIHADDRVRVVRSIQAALVGDKTRWSAAYRLRKADGDHAYVYDRGFIIRDEEGRAIRAVGAVVDLTERRRAEAELRRTQAELIHVSRVSAMGAMASTLAHELNQPLTAVTSYVRGSRRLLANFDDPAIRQVCEALEFAEAGALRAGQIVRRLRELVARGTVSVGPEDLLRLVGDASVLAFVDEHLHGISHKIVIDPDARWVEVDRIQIQQVLINLIRNAMQALQDSARREVTISARACADDLVEVSVADTGDGIADSVRDALFSPFHSTKAEGMGIGLSISRTIVEAHHGKIWAEDGPDGGAVFRFTLPRAEALPEELIEAAEGDRAERQVV